MKISRLICIIISCSVIHRTGGFPLEKDASFKTNKLEENPNLFEGDIRFPHASISTRGAQRLGQSVAWTNGIVPYEIESDYEPHERAFLVAVMQRMERIIAINNVVCVQFRPRLPSDQYYVTIRNGEECSAFIGQNPGIGVERILILDALHCLSEGLVMHELMHVLGFYHEQSRPDRDGYVKINNENIEPGMESNFEKYTNTQVNIANSPYDYSSIMHYSPYAFSSNNLPTIEPLQSNAEIGQRGNLSAIDIAEVRLFYKCPSNGPLLPTIHTGHMYSVNTTVSSSLTRNSLTYDRFGSENNYYESYEIHVSLDGDYAFASISSMDTYGYLYSQEFLPASPLDNLMETDDEGGGSSQFQIVAFLESTKKYILVVTTYYGSITGDYRILASGPAAFSIGKVNNVPATTVKTTRSTTPLKESISTYSSVLTTNSLTYQRPQAVGTFYYEAIEISTTESGDYTFRSTTTVDSYGYLYLNGFNPRNPMRLLLAQNDDDGGNSQFLLKYSLQMNAEYILIHTTFDEETMGSFSITASGPGKVQFNRIDNLS